MLLTFHFCYLHAGETTVCRVWTPVRRSIPNGFKHKAISEGDEIISYNFRENKVVATNVAFVDNMILNSLGLTEH